MVLKWGTYSAQNVGAHPRRLRRASDLARAIKREDVAETRRLPSTGFDVNAPCRGHPNTKGETPLMIAASRGNTAIIKLRLDAGANPNEPWPGQGSALARAAASKSAPAIILLLKNGADAGAAFEGRTVADFIRENWSHHDEIVGMLAHNPPRP